MRTILLAAYALGTVACTTAQPIRRPSTSASGALSPKEAAPAKTATRAAVPPPNTKAAPLAEQGPALRVVQLAMGRNYAGALLSNGRIMVWGEAIYSTITKDGVAAHPVPFEVPSIAGATKLALGEDRACVLLRDGNAECWGRDWKAWRASRHSTEIERMTKGDVVDLHLSDRSKCLRLLDGFDCAAASFGSLQQVTSNDERTCGVRTNGTVVCTGIKVGRKSEYWGPPGFEPAHTDVPLEVRGLSRVRVLRDSGRHLCAVVQSGEVHCIGFGESGQLGNGKYGAPYAEINAVKVLDLPEVEDVVVAGDSSCARTHSGDVYCWGANGQGQLGLGDTKMRLRATRVPSLTNVASLVAASGSVCALGADGGVLCWGANGHGQLGTGDRLPKNLPTVVRGLPRP